MTKQTTHRLRKKTDVPALFRLWNTELSKIEIAKQLGISPGALSRLAAKHKLPEKENGNVGRTRDVDPTPEELEARMAEIKAGWTDKDHEDRFCGPRKKTWQPPVVAYDATVGGFVERRMEQIL
jgi:hypothetical protein